MQNHETPHPHSEIAPAVFSFIHSLASSSFNAYDPQWITAKLSNLGVDARFDTGGAYVLLGNNSGLALAQAEEGSMGQKRPVVQLCILVAALYHYCFGEELTYPRQLYGDRVLLTQYFLARFCERLQKRNSKQFQPFQPP